MRRVKEYWRNVPSVPSCSIVFCPLVFNFNAAVPSFALHKGFRVARVSRGTLYEELQIEGSINIQNRSNLGTGHGWAGANNVLWIIAPTLLVRYAG